MVAECGLPTLGRYPLRFRVRGVGQEKKAVAELMLH